MGTTYPKPPDYNRQSSLHHRQMTATFLVTDVYGRGTRFAAGDAYVQRIFDRLRDLHYKTWLNVAFADFARIWCITPLHSLLYVQVLFSPPNKGTFCLHKHVQTNNGVHDRLYRHQGLYDRDCSPCQYTNWSRRTQSYISSMTLPLLPLVPSPGRASYA